MTTIGVLSDTHISDRSRRQIPPQLLEAFAGVSLILHGGDLVAVEVLDELENIAPVLAVKGNNDKGSFGLPRTRRVEVESVEVESVEVESVEVEGVEGVEVEGIVIGMAHGDKGQTGSEKPMSGISGNGITAANALSWFEHDGDVSCIVFGHSHNPLLHWHTVAGRKILLFNPGSPTDKRYAPNYSCGLLRVDGSQISGELIRW